MATGPPEPALSKLVEAARSMLIPTKRPLVLVSPNNTITIVA